MSAPGAYRFAAWPGLEPQAPRFEPAAADVAERVCAAMQARGEVERLANAADADALLRFSAAGGPRYFLKVVPAERIDEIERAETLARWLAERGAPVLPAEGRLREYEAGSRLLAYAYVDGRPPAPTAEDARALAAALGKLHRILRTHPDVERWKQSTARRTRRFEDVRSRVRAGTLQAGTDPGELVRLANDDSIELHPRALAATDTPLHGDLNLFNVVMTGAGPLFLDLEEVPHSVLPAAFDVAKLCERVILVREPSDERAREAIGALVGTYRDASGGALPPESELPAILRTLALRALCTLADLDPAATDPREWNKFFHLMEAASARPAALGAA